MDIGLVHADAASIEGHEEALRMLIRNLLDNAIKYTPPGGRVDIEVRSEDAAALLTVEDSGPGIAPQACERVLDRFYRVGDSDTTGAGLGLAIVKSIADLHRAHIHLDASPRLGGLRVTVRFPLQR